MPQKSLFLSECRPTFVAGVPGVCMAELLADIKRDAFGALRNPNTYQKLIWALGCLNALVAEFVSVGLLTPDDVADAFKLFEEDADPTVKKQYSQKSLDAAVYEGEYALSEIYQQIPPDVDVPIGQFGIATALTVLSAIGAIWKIWRMLSPSAGGDHSRHITKIRLHAPNLEK